jgi:hypothetical protein
VTHPRTNTKSVAARTRRRWPTAALHVGLRKAALTRLAEVGCTVHQIAAISGHKTLREMQRYADPPTSTEMPVPVVTDLRRWCCAHSPGRRTA